jgi:hypothetical protein
LNSRRFLALHFSGTASRDAPWFFDSEKNHRAALVSPHRPSFVNIFLRGSKQPRERFTVDCGDQR